jgi:hypothetical protein
MSDHEKMPAKTQVGCPAETWMGSSVLLKTTSSEQKCTERFGRRQVAGVELLFGGLSVTTLPQNS